MTASIIIMKIMCFKVCRSSIMKQAMVLVVFMVLLLVIVIMAIRMRVASPWSKRRPEDAD